MPVIPTNKPLEKRMKKDFYRTPEKYVWSNIIEVEKLYPEINPVIIDPCCGSGVFGAIARIVWPKAKIYGVDIQSKDEILNDPIPDLSPETNWEHYDEIYFSQAFVPGLHLPLADIIISNPPFSDIENFIETSFKYLEIGGILSLIGRSNFLEGVGRANGLWLKYPLFQYNLSARRVPWPNHPKGQKKQSDYETYAQYIWRNSDSTFNQDREFKGKIVLW